jgi:ferredoxin-NADP reductase
MSMLQWLIQSKQSCDVVLVNRVHSQEDLIFAKHLQVKGGNLMTLDARMGIKIRSQQ